MSQRSLENRVRVRSCGVLIEDSKLLLVELFSPVTNNWVWIPPGGEVEFGESLEETVIREFKEETGLTISVDRKLEINQVIKYPIHAIEVYFLVKREGGELGLGKDPELDSEDQILRNIGFFSKNELLKMDVVPYELTDKFNSLLDS